MNSASLGSSVFSRAGEKSFFKALNFKLPFKNAFHVDVYPRLNQLVEMKKEFNRYAVIISDDKYINIVMVNTGNITSDQWNEDPELYIYKGRIWSDLYYREKVSVESVEKVAFLASSLSVNHELIFHDSGRIVEEVKQAVNLGSGGHINPIFMDHSKVKLAALSVLDTKSFYFNSQVAMAEAVS